jgi:hypothetical protein
MGTEGSNTHEKDWIDAVYDYLKNWFNNLWNKWTKEESDLAEEIEEEIE